MAKNQLSATTFKSLHKLHARILPQYLRALLSISKQKKNKRIMHALPTLAEEIFSYFFKNFEIAQGNWSRKNNKKTRLFCQRLLQSALDYPEIVVLLNTLRLVVHQSMARHFSENILQTLSRVWDDFWLQGVLEFLTVLIQKRDLAIREKNTESSVLFHTTHSISTEPQSEPLFGKIVSHAGMLMRAKQVCLFLADPPETKPEPYLRLRTDTQSQASSVEYKVKFGEGTVGNVAQSRLPLLNNDCTQALAEMPFLSEVNRMLVVPITFSSELLGVLLAADKRRHNFTLADQELLVIFISQISASLKNFLLFQKQAEIAAILQEKNAMLEAQTELVLRKSSQLVVMNEVGQQINSSLDLPEVLKLLTRHAAESIGVNRSIVWLINEKKTGLDAVAVFGLSMEVLNKLVIFLPDIRKSRFFQALYEHHAVEIWEEQDEEFFLKYLQPLNNIRSLLAVPLLLKQQAIGLLAVDDTREKHEFLEDEVTLISAIANQAVLAIENARLYLQVKEQAITDGLTSLFNHRYFQLRFSEEFSNCKRYGNDLSLIILDIDLFKYYNDTYGHIAGDLALKEIANLARTSIRENDILARYGGEEFAIILPMTNIEGALVVAERIRQSVLTCKFLGDLNIPQVSITVSLGISAYSPDLLKSDALLKEADMALYQAKEAGRNRTVIFRPEIS